jgi:Zn-dependent protease with chaperone function
VTPTAFDADYFDGRTSRRRPVRVEVSPGTLAIRGEDVAIDVAPGQASVHPRLGSTPARIALPDGGLLVTPDFPAVEAALRVPSRRTLAHRLESHPLAVVVAMLGIAIGGWFMYQDGIPWASARIAERIPPEIESQLATETLKSIDSFIFRPSRAAPQDKAAVAAEFARLLPAAGVPSGTRLEFRDGTIAGPNALALPGGVIVVTDQLIDILEVREVAAVLAHELGHVHHRHGLRHVLNNSLHAFVVMAVFGDASAMAGVASTVPTVFINTAYSRDFEREADAFAVQLLKSLNLSPLDFADALDSLQYSLTCEEGGKRAKTRDFGYLSTHPDAGERMLAAEAAAGEGAREHYPRTVRPPNERCRPRHP